MAPIRITDQSGKIVSVLHNRKDRREYEKAHGVKIAPAQPGRVRLRPRTPLRPARHVTSRIPRDYAGAVGRAR